MWAFKHKLGGLLAWFAPTREDSGVPEGLAHLLRRFHAPAEAAAAADNPPDADRAGDAQHAEQDASNRSATNDGSNPASDDGGGRNRVTGAEDDHQTHASSGRNDNRSRTEAHDSTDESPAAQTGTSVSSTGQSAAQDPSPRPFDDEPTEIIADEAKPVVAGEKSVAPEPPLNVIVGTPRNDTLRGTAEGDMITGDTGHDRIYGYDGNDVIDADGGNDRAYGGDGNDTIDGGSGNDYVYGDLGNDTVDGGSGSDRVLWR